MKKSANIKKIVAYTIIIIVVITTIILILTGKICAQNLLENGDFETGSLDPWQVQEIIPGQVYVDTISFQSSYSLCSQIYTSGLEFWEIQPYYLLDSLALGGVYNLSFWHRGESNYPLEIILNLGGNTDPWPWMGLWDSVAVDSNWTHYENSFIVIDTSDTARLSFNVGHNVRYSKFWIDDVYLAESVYVDPEPQEPPDPEDVESTYLYPNPFRAQICLARPEETLQQQVLVYNIIGQKLDIELEDSLLNFANEPPGVYFVAVGNQIKK